MQDSRSKNPAIWRSFGALHPRRGVERIGRLVRDWFPAAWTLRAPPLPSTPAFQHMFLGLCMLADWIGSDETHFPFCDEPRDDYMQTARHNAHNALLEIGLNIESQRSAFHVLPALPNFRRPIRYPQRNAQPHSALGDSGPAGRAPGYHRVRNRLRENRGRAMALCPYVSRRTGRRTVFCLAYPCGSQPDAQTHHTLH